MNTDDLKNKLKELIMLPKETEWVEFKQNLSCSLDEIGEYISALSNSACLHNRSYGYFVFGIEDQTHKVVGTDFKPSQTKNGNEELENWLIRLLSPRIDFRINEFEYEGVPVVMFEINATHNTPVGFKGAEYIRVGSYKKKLKDLPEKARKIWNKTLAYSFEKDIAAKELDEDKILELLDYPGYFRILKSNLPADKSAILKHLEGERFILKEINSHSITNLGTILIANNLSYFERLNRKAIRVIIYKGNDRLHTKKEQIGAKGYANGFEGLIDYINDNLQANEEIGRAFRKEVKMYPEIAIRELVANALIHQDFNEIGTGPMIEIFNDRIEITNPGKPLISTLRFIDHHPQSRNEKVASFMRRAGICEERGSGIDKVIDKVEEYQLPAPKFIEGDNFLKVIMYSYKTLKQMDKDDKIRACYQHCCLKYVSNSNMTNQSLRERFKIDEKNYSIVSRIIADTIKARLIKDFDPENKSRKYAKYIPIWS